LVSNEINDDDLDLENIYSTEDDEYIGNDNDDDNGTRNITNEIIELNKTSRKEYIR